jgi:hypothetical protein
MKHSIIQEVFTSVDIDTYFWNRKAVFFRQRSQVITWMYNGLYCKVNARIVNAGEQKSFPGR